MEVVYEDNHLIVVNKAAGEIVQGDKTGDKPLSEMVKDYLREKYNKPGNVFCGVIHRLDRPVSGLVVFLGNAITKRMSAARLPTGRRKLCLTTNCWQKLIITACLK